MEFHEQLAFCKKCHNRRMNMDTGLFCSLTGEKPSFNGTCLSFDLDERMEAELNDSAVIEIKDLSNEKLREYQLEQNLPLGIFGGILAGFIGACLWALITVATGWQIGYMALAIGAGVGFSIRNLGKGVDPIFGISGAIIAVFSCIVGNFLSVMAILSQMEGLDFIETLLYFDYSYTLDLLLETGQFMDVVFYFIAGYEGYKFAFRKL